MGDTNYCDTPEAAKTKPHVGDPQNPSLEAIVALQPDLVLATTSINRLETADALKRLGIPVYTSDPHTVRGMLDSIRHMAEVMGAARQGAEVVARLQARLDALHARLHDPPLVHVLFVVWVDPLIIDRAEHVYRRRAALGRRRIRDYLEAELAATEHRRSGAPAAGYIVFADDHTDSKTTQLRQLRARPVWKDLQLSRRPRRNSARDRRPSPGLVDAIEQLARELHPEAFAAQRESGRRTSKASPDPQPFLLRIRSGSVRPLTPRRMFASALRCRRAVRCGGDFAAHGRLSDFGARHRDDAFSGAIGRGTRFRRNSGWSYSACGCRALRSGFWWALRFPPPAQDFRRCCAIRWPIPTSSACRAVRRWARF